jgi:hypothetical protein
MVRVFVACSSLVRRYRSALSAQNREHPRGQTTLACVTTAGSTGEKLGGEGFFGLTTSGTAPGMIQLCLYRHCPVVRLHNQRRNCAHAPGFVSKSESESGRPEHPGAPSQNSMRIPDQPLNGNIAISQFQLMECRVAAIRGLISGSYLQRRDALLAHRLVVIKPDMRHHALNRSIRHHPDGLPVTPS